jgi:hypothetical protein
MFEIADYWPDGVIDCKDYAVRNSIVIERMGHTPTWVVINKHVVVFFREDGKIYVFDNNSVYITKQPK